MNADLDALATALYVTIDDALTADPTLTPDRPTTGIAPKLSDAELLTLAVLQALLGYTNEARWIRHAKSELSTAFPYIPNRPGYNKRLRNSIPMMSNIIRLIATRCDTWHDDVWLIDSTPVECGRSRETAKRSNTAGYASYGYCASHTRYFWGLRLHILATPSGLPISFALADAKTDEREVARDLLDIDPALLNNRHGQTLIADKGYRSKEFDTTLTDLNIDLIRPATKTEPTRPGHQFPKPFRQIIESINQTLKAQLDLERHGGRSSTGIVTRVWQRILALTATIWYNERCAEPTRRSLTAYDH